MIGMGITMEKLVGLVLVQGVVVCYSYDLVLFIVGNVDLLKLTATRPSGFMEIGSLFDKSMVI
jgi:hypothetical protein